MLNTVMYYDTVCPLTTHEVYSIELCNIETHHVIDDIMMNHAM